MSHTAPAYAVIGEASARAESAAWSQFAAPGDRAEFCAAWLAILCAQIDRVGSALLLLGPEADGSYAAAASWPRDARRSAQHLAATAKRTLQERRGLIADGDGGVPSGRGAPLQMGYPIELEGRLHGAVVLELPHGSDAELQRAMRALHWASVWIVDRLRQQLLAEQSTRLAGLDLVAQVITTALQSPRAAAAALEIANLLAARLRCERVSIGFERGGEIEPVAISHTATFDPRTALVRAIGEAMDEALDLEDAVVHPAPHADALAGPAHAALATLGGHAALLSVPLVDAGQVVGALTLERGAALGAADEPGAVRLPVEPFDAATRELATTLGLLLGSMLQRARDNERGLLRRLHDALRAGAGALFGPGHPGLKLGAVIACVGLALLAWVPVPYRVAARASVEGAVVRAAVVPFDGYIAAALVRPGDTVKRDQPLATMEQRDLLLEQSRSLAEQDIALRRLRQAAAAQDRATALMAQAQADQAQAQLDLTLGKLARATVKAPFDGVVVSGDLSQSLGSPVEQGKVLFEVAPLGDYRIALQVDERDIGELQIGQHGWLALAALPHDALRFTVHGLTPISAAQEGHNLFRVEAHLDQPDRRLRPGMEGVGKVGVGPRKLLWVWTHGLVDGLQLWLWRWLP